MWLQLRAKPTALATLPYVVALFASVAALAFSLALMSLEPRGSFAALLFLGAVGLAAANGGLGPALVPTVAGGLALDFFFETPRNSLMVSRVSTVVDVGAFVFVALLVSVLNHRLHAANHQLREERDRAEAAVRARDELIATVSHALRTPLTAIQASLYSLRDRTTHLPATKRDRLLANVSTEADRLVQFVSDALTLSRLETAPPVPPASHDLGEVVWAALEHCRPLLGDRVVTFAIPSDLPLARCDAGLLDQTVTVLIENVAAHTPPGSPVWIDAEARDERRVVLKVSDAGPGIPLPDRERIFGKYERVEGRGPGVGLGLAVARAAVHAQGGRIWADDSPHGGARLVVEFPADVPASSAT
jgi:K+-sensing histidine kinase KdpD